MTERSQHDPTPASELKETNREFISGEAELVKAGPRIAANLLRKMGEPLEMAEDVAQAGLFKYFQIAKEQRGEIKNKKAFLYRIMRNDFLNKVRKEGSYVLTSLEEFETKPLELSETVSLEDVETGMVLREIWNRLQGEDAQLFRLLVLGLTGRELALALGISRDAARQRVFRLLDKLRRMVRKR